MSLNLDLLLELVTSLAQKAGQKLVQMQDKLEIYTKKDGSPVSSADLVVNELLCEGLKQSKIAVCSEEKPLSFEQRKDLEAFWLIDPLDGTKGYIKGSTQYCILIALIKEQRPILALIADPAKKNIYSAHLRSPLLKNGVKFEPDQSEIDANSKIALISVHHPDERNEKFLTQNALQGIKISSALKFVALLEGRAGVYHRFESLNSWDIAAGDFLLNQSKGIMIQMPVKDETKLIEYNQQSFLCPGFLALSDKAKLQNVIV